MKVGVALVLLASIASACGSSADESTELTIVGSVVDGQGAPVAGQAGQVCVIGTYKEGFVGGESYELTSCAAATIDASGKFSRVIVLGPQLKDVKSSYLVLSPDPCHYSGTVLSPISIQDAGSHRASRIDVPYVVAPANCT